MGPAEWVRGLTIRGTTGLRVMIGLAVVSAGVLLVGVVWVEQRDDLPSGNPGDVLRVGLVPGESVAGYLTSSRVELATLTDPSAPAAGDTWALVSLTGYVAPARLPALLDGAAVAQVYARVPLPGVHTQVVRIPIYRFPGDVAVGMLDAARQRDQEQAEYLQLDRRLLGDGAGAERARQAYGMAAGTAAAEAAAYRSGCACVFAAVVRAAPPALRSVADRVDVRVVDPAPEVRDMDRTEFRPPLPEQVDAVPADPSPPSAPVPTGGSAIAPRMPARLLSSLGAAVRSTSPAGPVLGSDPSATALEERAAVPSAADANLLRMPWVDRRQHPEPDGDGDRFVRQRHGRSSGHDVVSSFEQENHRGWSVG